MIVNGRREPIGGAQKAKVPDAAAQAVTTQATRGAGARLMVASEDARRLIWLPRLVLGLLLAAWAIAVYGPRPAVLMPTRVVQMEDQLNGPGGLVACPASGVVPDHLVSAGPGCYRSAVGDDPGMFLVVPIVTRATGVPVAEVMKWSAISSLAIALVALPFLLGPAWLLAPLVVVADPLRSFDIYWIPAIAYLVAFPLLLRWRWDPRLLLVVALAGGLVSVFRGGSGLPLLAGAIAVNWRWAPALALAYFVPVALEPQTGRFWHSIYIGLGYLPNPWGLAYRDEIGIATMFRLAPEAGYQTPAYEALLRGEVFRIATADPGFVIRTVAEKLLAVGVGPLIGLWASLGLARGGLILAPAIVLATVPALLAVPEPNYLAGLDVLVSVGMAVAIVTLAKRYGGKLPQLYQPASPTASRSRSGSPR